MNTITALLYRSVLVLIFLSLVSCGDSDMTDLKSYVAQVNARENKKVEPLEPIKLVESFFYTAYDENFRSPFKSFLDELPDPNTQVVENNNPVVMDCPRPDPNRRREVLEYYPINELTLVGVFFDDAGYASEALVEDPEGITHRVKQGNYLGKNHGRVEFISAVKLDVRELEQDGQGCYREREASIAMKTE